MPTADSGWPPERVRTDEPGPLLDDAYRQLVEQLDIHGPADHAATWWPPDQTVGFWLRRMAHETSIHRRDVESAVGAETPVAPDLAVDGIDEVLALMLAGDWSDEVVPEASGATVLLEGGGHRWAVTLQPGEVTLDRSDADADADTDAEPGALTARVVGEPGQLVLWLWGRGPQPSADGSPAAVASCASACEGPPSDPTRGAVPGRGLTGCRHGRTARGHRRRRHQRTGCRLAPGRGRSDPAGGAARRLRPARWQDSAVGWSPGSRPTSARSRCWPGDRRRSSWPVPSGSATWWSTPPRAPPPSGAEARSTPCRRALSWGCPARPPPRWASWTRRRSPAPRASATGRTSPSRRTCRWGSSWSSAWGGRWSTGWSSRCWGASTPATPAGSPCRLPCRRSGAPPVAGSRSRSWRSVRRPPCRRRAVRCSRALTEACSSWPAP